MPAYLSKSKDEILRQALRKLADRTPITSVGPGSIARSLAEVITDDLGNFYSSLDYNMSQSVLSTASGRALDLIGDLYGVERKRLSELATIDQSIGSFYFYITAPYNAPIIIPSGTRVSTTVDDLLGTSFVYATSEDTVIHEGRLRAYVPLRPLFEDSVFTAGVGMLNTHNFVGPIDIKCTNAKPITPSIGYEPDNDYRIRIRNAVRVASGGTATALRFATLAIPGVRDVVIRQAPYGLGSAEVIVVAEDYSQSVGILNKAVQVVDLVRPIGVKTFVKLPELQNLDVSINIVIPNNANLNNDAVIRRARNTILRFINNLAVAAPLVYNQLVSHVLENVPEASDIVFSTLAINGSQILRTNYVPPSDTQIIPGDINISIVTST